MGSILKFKEFVRNQERFDIGINKILNVLNNSMQSLK